MSDERDEVAKGEEANGLFDRSLSRASLFKKAAVGGVAGMSLPALLAACGGDDDDGDTEAQTGTAGGENGDGEQLNFYSVTHGETGNVFWAIYRNGIRDGQRDFGVSVNDLPLENFAVAGYVDLLNQAISAQPDGIFCSILDQEALDEPLRRAIEGGIPVVAVNVPDSRELEERIPYLFYVGGDEEAGGRLTAQRQLQENANIGRAVCIIHEPGHTGLEARCRGYDAELSDAGARVDKLPSSKDATQATEQIKNYLQSNQDVNAIFGVGPQPATFALQALNELGKEDVLVSAYDMDVALLDAMDEGTLVSTIDQQQYLQGYLPISWLKLHIQHGFVLAPGVDMLTGPALVDSSNVAQVREGVNAKFR